MRKKILIIVLVIVAFFYVIYGIYQYLSVDKKQPQETKVPSKQLTPSLQQEEKFTDESLFKVQTYDAGNVRDPFAHLIIKRETKGVLPIENYDVEEFKLIGIIKDNKEAKALLKTPDGKFFTVKENDKIGRHGGKIIKIGKEEIQIKEYIKTYTGEIQQVSKILKLRTEEMQ